MHTLWIDRTADFDPAAGESQREFIERDPELVSLIIGAKGARWALLTGDDGLAAQLIARDGVSVALWRGILGRDEIPDFAEAQTLLEGGEFEFVDLGTRQASDLPSLVDSVARCDTELTLEREVLVQCR